MSVLFCFFLPLLVAEKEFKYLQVNKGEKNTHWTRKQAEKGYMYKVYVEIWFYPDILPRYDFLLYLALCNDLCFTTSVALP